MKYFIYITLLLFFASCDDKTETITNSPLPDKPKKDPIVSNVLTFQFITNFTDPNISNSSGRQIDLLFNGVEKYFGGHMNPKVDFHTECLQCEPIQKVSEGLLFAQYLLITSDQIKYYKNGRYLPDSVNRIKLTSGGEEGTNIKFQFTEGKGSIKNKGISCDDADFNKVRLTYPSGEIVIDSLINATFFEYDLNKDEQIEQYLFGTRTCTQEFVLLRIKNKLANQ